MPKRRVKPGDVTISKRLQLKKRKQYEMRVILFGDQRNLIHDWAKENNTTVANVVRKCLNYFIHVNESKKKKIIRDY